MSIWSAIGGAVLGGGSSLGSQLGQSAFSAHQAAKNRDFQYNMASTQYQRGVEDLKKAGLNPILAATGGLKAGVGSGAMAQAAAGDHVGSARQAAIFAEELRKMKLENYILDQQGEILNYKRSVEQLNYNELWRLAGKIPGFWSLLSLGQYGQGIAQTAKDLGIGLGAVSAGAGKAVEGLGSWMPWNKAKAIYDSSPIPSLFKPGSHFKARH